MNRTILPYLACPVLCLAASSMAGRLVLPPVPATVPTPDVMILTPSLAPDIVPATQAEGARSWLTWEKTPTGSFRVERSAIPSRLITVSNGLFVLSQAERSIRLYSHRGRLLRRYGPLGDGARPISDFAVTSDGLVWVADPNGITKALHPDGSAAKQLPAAIRALTIASIGDTLVIQPVATPVFEYGDAMLLLVSPGRHPTALASFVEDHARFGMAVSGIPVASPSGDSFYYVTRSAGLLASYSPAGELRYLTRTIAAPELPSLELTPTGATKLPAQGDEFLRSVAVRGRYLLTLTDVKPGDPLQRDPTSVVDAYDRATGRYVGSFALPARMRAITTMADTLYTASNNDILSWTLPPALTQ
ncbi:MAG: hypothetical protein GEV06_25670 [Luteitalea sp.]|nr:hypothetical protein [Luteitalea sp.]